MTHTDHKMTQDELLQDAKNRHAGAVVKKKRKRNYINNPDFNEALAAYKDKVDRARAEGRPDPIIPDYIGKAILHIATRYASKPNFSGYAFKEDMIMDGAMDAIKYGVKSYNPHRESTTPPNPFAYFTQIIKNAFIRRIKKEKENLAIKYKASQHTLLFNGTYDGDMSLNIDLDADHMDTFLENYDKSIAPKPKKEQS